MVDSQACMRKIHDNNTTMLHHISLRAQCHLHSILKEASSLLNTPHSHLKMSMG